MDTLSIRPARAADADALTALALASKRYWGYPEHFIELWRDALTVDAAAIGAGRVHLAVDGAGLAGFYALGDDRGRCELDALFVAPARIGRGVGRQLFRHACERARRAGARELIIASDPNAEAFYRKQGAVRIGDTPSLPRGRRLPVMTVALTAEALPASSVL